MTIALELVRSLAAYIPVTLTRQILTSGLPTPGQSREFMAATLFSDISGFTALSEELASDGPRGAEELNRILLLTFTDMIELIHKMGGAINHFHGDAMSVHFPDDDGQAALRALSCAQMMQRLMATKLNRITANRPPGKNPSFDLTIKIGLGYGQCLETIVGSPEVNLEYTLVGTAVNDATAAEQLADSGEIFASREMLEKAGFPAANNYNLLSPEMLSNIPSIPAGSPILDWDSIDNEALELLGTAVPPFIPPTIYERTTSGLSEMAEHRPVTSIFVQFEFHEPQIGRDESLLQSYYQWANQVVARFGGANARLNRVLTGDKGNQLHIIFGAPIAPDVPAQAIRCALALQRERPAFVLQQRIGLAAGKVFASPVGASKRHEYTVVGDVINLSARLAQVCDDGQILTDKITANRVKKLIEFIELAPIQLKGKQSRVNLYQPRGERGMQAQLQVFASLWKKSLIGREQELDLLLGGMDAALRGTSGVAALFGSTGTGKTSLLALGVKHWLDSGGIALAGECQQHTTDIPFGPWRTIWRDFFGLTSTMDAGTQIMIVITRTRSLVPDCGEDVGLWGDMLGLPFPQSDYLTNLPAEVRQSRFFNLVRRVFQAVSSTQPLLIILEGLHWADQSSLALIDELSAHQIEQAIFLAITYRPLTQLNLETVNRPSCVPIVLSDFPPKHGREFLQRLVGTADLPQSVEQHLGLRSRDGLESPVNPMFLEEAVNVMIGLGALEVNGRVRVNESLLAQMQIPDTIHGLLLARIDRLPIANRDLLQIASVIGRQFDLAPLLSIASGTSHDQATNILADLTTREITQLLTTNPEWTYLFQHAMTHEVAYESLPFARRQKLHAAIANWLVKEHRNNLKPFHAVLAYHFSRAGDHINGLHFAIAAGDSARDIFANKEAVELYTMAEEHLLAMADEDNWETAVEIYLARGDVLILLGDLENTLLDAQQALELASKHHAVKVINRSYNLMAETRYRQGQYDQAQNLAQKVIASDLTATPDQLARAYTWFGLSASAKMDYTVALNNLQQAQEICFADNNNYRLARVLEAMGFIYFAQKELELALQTMQQSVELSRNFSTTINIGIGLNNVAFIQFTAGKVNEALDTFNEVVALGKDVGQNLYALALSNRAATLAYLGRFPQALRDFKEALILLDSMNYPGLLVETYLFWGYDYSSALEDWDDAHQFFNQAKKLIDIQPESYPEEKTRLLIGLGQIELKSGSVKKAQSLLDEAATMIHSKNLGWWQPAVLYLVGLVKLQQNDKPGAHSQFQTALQSIENGGCPDYLPLILLELAELESVQTRRLELFNECLLAAQKRGRYIDRIHCYEKAGRALTLCDQSHLRKVGQGFLEQRDHLLQLIKK